MELGTRALTDHVQPDLRSSGPAATLARTLFVSSALASSGASAHEAVAKDLAKVKEALQFAEWQQFFVSPIITPAERHATLKELFDKIGASEITRQFFARLVESKATKYVASMIDVHAQIVRSQKNEVSATIVTARPMTASETTKLRAAIAAHFVDSGPSTKVLLEQRVDPSILGGLQLTVGSTYVDFSLKAQVDEIEAEFAAHNSAKFESLLLRQV